MFERVRGTVKNYNESRGFGFVRPDEGDEDVFVHVSGFVDGLEKLYKNDVVEYRVTQGRDGRWRGIDVRLV